MKRNWGHLVLPACFALGLVVGLSVASHFKIDDRGNELDTINTERRVQKLEAAAAQKAFEVARLSALVSAASSHAEVNDESVKLEEKLGRWIEQIESLKRYLRQVPSLSIPEMTYLSPRDWLDATKGKVLQTDADFRRTFAEPRNQAKIIVGQKMANALRAAAAAVDGGDTPSEAVFRRALESAVGEEILQRYKLSRVPPGVEQTPFNNEWILRESVTADPIWDNRYTVASDGSISCDPLNLPILRQMSVAMEQYRKEHGVSAETLAQIGYTPSSTDERALALSIIEASKAKVREQK